MSKPVDMVVVPGGDGDFGVLPGHIPMISTVRNGVITTYKNNKVEEKIFVSGGFAEVVGDRCTGLAEEATPVEKLDRDALRQELAHLQEDLNDAKADDVRDQIRDKIALAQAKLDAAN